MRDEKLSLTLSTQRRLEQAVDSALADATALWEKEQRYYPHVLEMAEGIYVKNPELMEEAKKMVLLDRLCWLLKRRKTARFQQEFRQMDLPGLELPRTIYLKNGSRPRLEICTAREIDEGIRLLEGQAREKQNPKIRRLKIARQMMEPYRKEAPNVTWGEVKQKEAERRDFDRLVGS